MKGQLITIKIVRVLNIESPQWSERVTIVVAEEQKSSGCVGGQGCACVCAHMRAEETNDINTSIQNMLWHIICFKYIELFVIDATCTDQACENTCSFLILFYWWCYKKIRYFSDFKGVSWTAGKKERKRGLIWDYIWVLKIKWPTPHATEALQSGVLFTSPTDKKVKLQTLQQGTLFMVSRNFIKSHIYLFRL